MQLTIPIPESRQVEVYTAAGIDSPLSPETLSGDPVLPGFKLELGLIWNPPF